VGVDGSLTGIFSSFHCVLGLARDVRKRLVMETVSEGGLSGRFWMMEGVATLFGKPGSSTGLPGFVWDVGRSRPLKLAA
jgi:hypothetical protein